MKKLSLVILISIASVLGYSQGYEIKLEIKGLQDTTVYLANYFGKKMYYADTAMVDQKGMAMFEGKEAFPGGKYAIVMPGPKFFDILLDDQKFEISTSYDDYVNNITFKGSKDNDIYYDYIRYIAEKKEEINGLKEKLDTINKESDANNALMDQMKVIDDAVKARQNELFDTHSGSFASTVIGMTIPIEIPPAPTDENGNITDSLFQFRHYIDHFFDKTPLEDGKIVRTPEYDRKLSDFFTKALPQSPDTLTKYADWILPQVKHDPDLYKFTLHFLTYYFQSSKFMGMDRGYVHMVENYYTKGGITWMDSTKLADVIEEAMLIKPTLIGEKAPYFKLHDPTVTKFTSLYDIQSDYTLVYIWQPECGHCKKTNPKLVELNEKYKDKGLKILPICVDFENDKWLEYLEEHPEFAKLHNLSDSPKHPSPFRSLYNSRTTPTILLLDKDKTIIAKKLEIEQLDNFIERRMKQKS